MLYTAAQMGAEAALARMGAVAPMNLGNCTAQPQDTPLQEENNAMAKRLQRRVQIGVDEFGNPVYKAAHGYNSQEVNLSVAKILADAGKVDQDQRTKQEDSNIPLFGAYLADFQKTFKRKLAQTTKETYRQLIRKHIDPALGMMPVNKITTGTLQKLFDDMVDRGLSLETIKKVRNIIKPALASAAEDGYIQKNPADSKRLKINTDKQGGHVALPPEVVARIDAGLYSLPINLRREVALLRYTGLRIGEVIGLQWPDIDLDNREIHIVRAVSYPNKNQPIVGNPKTKASQRIIPLTDSLLNALMPIQESGFIISGEKPLTFAQERRMWKKIQKHFDIEQYTHHDFRDTCATEWREAGIQLEVISQILGHEDVSTTTERYIKPRKSAIQEAGRMMERYTNASIAANASASASTSMT